MDWTRQNLGTAGAKTMGDHSEIETQDTAIDFDCMY